MTDPNKTAVTVILDSSGSMSSCFNDTIGGFNTFLESQQKLPGECEISLLQFSNTSNFTYKSKNIKDAPKLSAENYHTGGGTALLDAIGKAINEKGAELAALTEDQRPEKVIMIIITDGEENTSKEFSHTKIKEMIDHQTQKYSWVFTFLGANLDAVSTAQSLGIAAGSSLNFSSTTKGGASRAFSAASAYLGRTRGASKGASVAYTTAEIAANQTP